MRGSYYFQPTLLAKAGLDYNDLKQEAALFRLRGRKSTRGPMLDALRRGGWIKQTRSNGGVGTSRVDLDSLSVSPTESQSIAKVDCDRLMSRLNSTHFRVITLKYLQGMNEVEISKILKVSINNVRFKVGSAMKKLRGMVNDSTRSSNAARLVAQT